MPENMQDGERGEKAEEVAQELDEIAGEIADLVDRLNAARE